MIKLAVIDVETTGLDAKRHTIHSIAARFVNFGEEKTFNIKCKPLDGAEIDDDALAVGGITRDDFETYLDPIQARNALERVLSLCVNRYTKSDKLFFVAYNARFDYEHLRAWWERAGGEYFGSYFWFPPIDVMNLAAHRLMSRRHLLENFKLHTVAKALGFVVDESRLHDAAYDVELTLAMFKKLYNDERQ
jgi:DNA polymerase III subunit epsilon